MKQKEFNDWLDKLDKEVEESNFLLEKDQNFVAFTKKETFPGRQLLLMRVPTFYQNFLEVLIALL
jgi:hypothetical protein